MRKNKTRTARVRAAAQKLKTFTALELADETADARKKIYAAIQELFKRGEFQRIAPGRYEYVDGRQPVSIVEQRILRAIYIRGLFRIKDIKILTDAESGYIRRLTRRLISAGHIEHIGNFHKEKQYRVKNRDQFYLIYIQGKANVPKTD